jgi:hypothetical protein
MVFADEVLHIHGSPAHLLSVHLANQWLFADRIFLAHAASLRQASFFARWKFRGFLHSFEAKGGAPAAVIGMAGSFGAWDCGGAKRLVSGRAAMRAV